ncbi:ATP-binding protein [Paenibacillus yanchengensis]|uniref:histidine kinase n=1 Tax=Paenibacillus yanchengensis TaxID=2035833 RepID=A0ABW4YIQ4_9BACL
MKRSSNKQKSATVPLLRYWTGRFTLVVVALLIIVLFLGLHWLKDNAVQQQFAVLEARAELLASYYSKEQEQTNKIIRLNAQDKLQAIKMVPAFPADLFIQIYHLADKQIKEYGENHRVTKEVLLSVALPAIEEPLPSKELLTVAKGKYLRVGVAFFVNEQLAGKYYVTKKMDTHYIYMYWLFIAAIGAIALCGWLVVYLLARSLTKPLRQLSHASIDITSGYYEPDLPKAERIKEAEINQLITAFQAMSNRLQQLEQMRADMLASISHELRTPITSIRGMIQAVQEEVVIEEEAAEFLQISMQETERLQLMVNQLLDFSYLESSNITAQQRELKIVFVVEQVIVQFRLLNTNQAIIISLRSEVDQHITWLFDEYHLKQILLNLLDNSVHAGATQLSVVIYHNKLEIIDNGNGIAAAELPFIFERYYRGDSKRKKKQGLGLGLPICRLLAEANDASITVTSSDVQGSRFSIQRNDHK